MKPSERELAKTVLLQVGYFCLAVGAGYVAYLIEGEIDVQGTWGTWKLGGAVGAFVVILLVLIAFGPTRGLLDTFEKLSKLEVETFEELSKLEVERERERPQVSSDIVLRPGKRKHYAKLFEGFTESEFVAFNAPFRLETTSGRVDKAALDVHLQRYQQGVTSRYLFYERGSYDRAVGFFTDLRERASQKGISLAEGIELQYSPTQDPPTYTFFAGDRSGVGRCILYPSAITKEGLPHAVIAIDGAENLLGILAAHFDEQWIHAEESANTEYWSPESEL